MNDMEKTKTILRHLGTLLYRFVHGLLHLLWLIIDTVVLFIRREWVIASREGRLSLGTILLLAGIFNFRADKFCDGNTAVYNACARPVVYYMYPWWAILLILLGALLLLGYWKRVK